MSLSLSGYQSSSFLSKILPHSVPPYNNSLTIQIICPSSSSSPSRILRIECSRSILIYENYAILHTPLCEDQPQSFPFFNYNSLSELDEGHYFSWPRNAPCVDYWKYWGALAVALIISLFWLVGDVHLRRNEGDERR